MKAFLLASVFVMAAVTQAYPTSSNQPFPDTQKMTCAQVQDYVARNGSVTLTTGGAFASFSSEYCPTSVPGYVCTKDVNDCHVGIYCDWNFTAVNPQHYKQGTESCQPKG